MKTSPNFKNIDKRKEDVIARSFMVEKTINVDETGLFYRAMLTRTYWTLDDDRATARGTKALKAKDLITLVFFVNATGMIIDCKYIHF